MASPCEHITQESVRLPSPAQSVYREDCTQCFGSIDDSEGLNVCLWCFNGFCPDHARLHTTRSQHSMFLNIKRRKKHVTLLHWWQELQLMICREMNQLQSSRSWPSPRRQKRTAMRPSMRCSAVLALLAHSQSLMARSRMLSMLSSKPPPSPARLKSRHGSRS
jgi:hypothetical protein